MKSFVIRGIDEVTYQAIQEEARKAGTSMNQYLLRKLGASGGTSAVPKRDLSKIFGVWSQGRADQALKNLKAHRKIDWGMWK